MHACPECGMACDCDGEDLWHDWPFNLDCTHECEDEDDEPYLDDDAWSCECHICPECGEMPRDCSNTECSKTCSCSECRYCRRGDTHPDEPINPLAEKLGISIEKAGAWRITPDGLERIEEQPVIRCEAIKPRWTGKPRRKWKLRRKRNQ